MVAGDPRGGQGLLHPAHGREAGARPGHPRAAPGLLHPLGLPPGQPVATPLRRDALPGQGGRAGAGVEGAIGVRKKTWILLHNKNYVKKKFHYVLKKLKEPKVSLLFFLDDSQGRPGRDLQAEGPRGRARDPGAGADDLVRVGLPDGAGGLHRGLCGPGVAARGGHPVPPGRAGQGEEGGGDEEEDEDEEEVREEDGGGDGGLEADLLRLRLSRYEERFGIA